MTLSRPVSEKSLLMSARLTTMRVCSLACLWWLMSTPKPAKSMERTSERSTTTREDGSSRCTPASTFLS